jgi:hypothetical protein
MFSMADVGFSPKPKLVAKNEPIFSSGDVFYFPF